MSTFGSVEEAREYFKGDAFAAANGICIDELLEDGCICSMTLRDDHRNAMGGVMGGVIFTLADLALAVAGNNDHHPSVAMDVDIRFLGGVKGSRLKAEAHRVQSGRTTGVYTVDVTHDLGRKIAFLTGTGYNL